MGIVNMDIGFVSLIKLKQFTMKGKCEKMKTGWKNTIILDDLELNELLQMTLRTEPRNAIARRVRNLLSEIYHSCPSEGVPYKCEI